MTTSEETMARRRKDSARKRRDTAEGNREEERRVERARREAAEMSGLEAKWEKNRLRRLERERWEAERLKAWSLPKDPVTLRTGPRWRRREHDACAEHGGRPRGRGGRGQAFFGLVKGRCHLTPL